MRQVNVAVALISLVVRTVLVIACIEGMCLRDRYRRLRIMILVVTRWIR